MARNQEKAQSMLNRLVQAKRDAAAGPKQRRPHLASEVDSLSECEKWRGQIIRLIAKEVSIIQNASLGEHKIRDLNDRINKLMREKRAWEHQIKALGGNDYIRDGIRVTDSDGKRAFGTDGYFYFGAARELPGVRELFDKKNAPSQPKQSRAELYHSVNADYYGYRDDDDAALKPLEAKQEQIARAKAVEKHNKQLLATKIARLKALGLEKAPDGSVLDDKALAAMAEADDSTGADASGNGSGSGAAAAAAAGSAPIASAAAMSELKAHVILPTEADMEKLVLEKKRKDLMAKYGPAITPTATPASAKSSKAGVAMTDE